jgi:PBP1b-binding outer membrane lipoprotein LpoB
MRPVSIIAIALLLAGCGVETAGTAATAAAAKKQEVEQGRKTLEQAGARAAGAMEQGQARLREAEK